MAPQPTTERGGPLRTDGASAPMGEEPAWIREHLGAVLRFAARRLPLADAEDVTSEAAQALLEAERAGRAPEVPGAYLLGVARRRVADRLRRRAKGHVPVALPAGWDRICDAPLPEEALASRELAELVEIALDLLPEQGAALLRARYREGLPVAALAERWASSPKAIEGRLARARSALRVLLLEAGQAWLEPERVAPDADDAEARA